MPWTTTSTGTDERIDAATPSDTAMARALRRYVAALAQRVGGR